MQCVAELVEQRLRLVGAEQAAGRHSEAAHDRHDGSLVAAVHQPPAAAQREVRRPRHLSAPDQAAQTSSQSRIVAPAVTVRKNCCGIRPEEGSMFMKTPDRV